MSKGKTEAYRLEGIRRADIRKAKRKSDRKLKYHRYGQGDSTCIRCGNAMSWCSTCQMWSSNCCTDYGTCQCS